MRALKIPLLLVFALTALAACATRPDRGIALDKAQYAYSAAIRWGDFEGAWHMVDPAYRQAHPMTDFQFNRYKQMQISGYRDLGAQVGDGTAQREIQLGVINRNTLVERDTRYTELWRYDAATTTWWLVTGLPDLWQGQ